MNREVPYRYYVWVRYMRIYRKCYVSSRSPFNATAE